jgi:hypothetical protein
MEDEERPLAFAGRPQAFTKAMVTARQPFSCDKVVAALEEQFVGRSETIRTFLQSLRVARTMFVFGRCRDKHQIVQAACRAAGLLIVHVDCTLVESTQQLFEYILSRVDIVLDEEKRRCNQKKLRKQSASAAVEQQQQRGGGSGSGSRSGAGAAANKKHKAVVDQVVRHDFEKCTRASDFVKQLGSTLRWQGSGLYRGKMVALLFRCANASGARNALHCAAVERCSRILGVRSGASSVRAMALFAVRCTLFAAHATAFST